jgi:hypothetical protein
MRSSRRRGVTLVEAVIGSGLLLLVAAGVVALSVAGTNAWSSNSSQMMADGSASMALQRLSQEVRSGLRASVSPDGTRLSVVLPWRNSEGDYDRFTDGATVTYYLSGTDL